MMSSFVAGDILRNIMVTIKKSVLCYYSLIISPLVKCKQYNIVITIANVTSNFGVSYISDIIIL